MNHLAEIFTFWQVRPNSFLFPSGVSKRSAEVEDDTPLSTAFAWPEQYKRLPGEAQVGKNSC